MSNTLTRSRILVVTLAIAVAGLISGCFVKNTIKSELSTYAEPTDGALVHIRLIGSRNVKVYPSSTCVAYTVPGSGYPAGPQMGGQRKRDLDMPKPGAMPKHFVEVAARADEPITASFSHYSELTIPGAAGAGAPNTRRSSSCIVARSFVPQSGRNYEMTANWLSAGLCSVQVFEIVAEGAGYTRRPVPSRIAEGCAAPNETSN
ncbi:hypothetical protein [Lysobacter sp. FW306-1B-D06B]|uniref:hypothetical protein n=1 Tax=Lysobacter sp. FW306-1B-D06B TaxID=3140250 RepID=UPI0031406413